MIDHNDFNRSCFPAGASGKEPACQCRRPKRHGLKFCGWAGRSVHLGCLCYSQLAHLLDWLVHDGLNWDSWGLCVCSLLSPSKYEVDHTVAGFQRAARKGKPRCTDIIQASASVTFAHFLLAKASHMAELGVSGGGHSELQHKDCGYKERENLWPSFVLYCSAKQTLYPVLCTLYKEGGLEPTGTQCFSGIQLKKKKKLELCWKARRVKTGNLKLAIDKE